MGSGQLGQGSGRVIRGGGRSNAAGEVGDGGAGRRVARRPVVGVEVRVAGNVVALGPETGDSGGGKTVLVLGGQALGYAVVALVDAYDGQKARALEDAVRWGVALSGEEFLGVRVAADLDVAVDAEQGRFSYGDRWAERWAAGGSTATGGWASPAAARCRSSWTA
ncbi:hypothetical protein GCM10010264_21330 [Streptomyces globisporus]|nr:hypothetical protein GCM10010264_21330 [Streptomyces globisporus]